MFAVPGWSVSADNLKPETTKALAPEQQNASKPKKRKRPSAPSNVTAGNVADLWEQVIEGKSRKKPKAESAGRKEPKKKQDSHVKEKSAQDDEVKDGSSETARKDEEGNYSPQLLRKEKKKRNKELKAKAASQDGKAQVEDANEARDGSVSKKSKRGNKKQRREPRSNGEEQEDDNDGDAKAQAEEEPSNAAAPPAPKLTPLQAAMREKLISARFRHLNETLYTRPSAEAFQLFRESPEMFQEYHEGFRRQVDVWPENPVDSYIAEVQTRGRQRGAQSQSQHQHRQKSKQQQQHDADVAPLPRTGGTCTIADLGCGDAKLAAALRPSRRQLRVEVLSYDLHGTAPHVAWADIANLPLADGAVDVAVFCLALMGTNWLDFVEEAYRVLRWRGELWVAEIKSRFSGAAAKKNNSGGGGGMKGGPVGHSVGNRRKAAAAVTGKKGGKGKNADGGDGDDGADDEADLAVEVDGAEDRRRETDVSGFVEALRRRGFVLQGEPDLRNRMFVKMRFAKAASATVGKCAVPPPPSTSTSSSRESGGPGGRGGGPRRNTVKFIDGAEGQERVDESRILKPCVYKIR
ncbi:hypothetical protein DL764_009958 [Monosporascus ibericus]|uniref:Ribosomal RNA-processing protein 8 n=1 Tax=Monosporascus ibericus TaxID=155417 RepID=A0A4Q4STP8_9PEZI|nr:hypothetical protein DL764_009958 [Monosporascus ibericus]